MGRKTGEEMPRRKEEEGIEPSLTARVTGRKRVKKKEWQEEDEVRRHAKLSSKQVANNARDKLSYVLNEVKRKETAKVRAMSPCEKEKYQGEKRQEKKRSKETARVEASFEAHEPAWGRLLQLLADVEADLARLGGPAPTAAATRQVDIVAEIVARGPSTLRVT